MVKDVGPQEAVQPASSLRAGRLLPVFAQAARSLVARGACAITTSCGFLVLLQRELQHAVPVPVVTSSLLLLPELLDSEDQVGVLTISAQRLDDEYFFLAGVPRGRRGDIVVEGVDPRGEFARAILGNDAAMDLARAGRDVVAAAVALRTRAPHVRTLVLECTNMPPYAQAIREATGLRVLGLADSPVLRDFLAGKSAQPLEGAA